MNVVTAGKQLPVYRVIHYRKILWKEECSKHVLTRSHKHEGKTYSGLISVQNLPLLGITKHLQVHWRLTSQLCKRWFRKSSLTNTLRLFEAWLSLMWPLARYSFWTHLVHLSCKNIVIINLTKNGQNRKFKKRLRRNLQRHGRRWV